MIRRIWCARLRGVLPMIRLIDQQEASGLLSFCAGSPYGVRIAAFLAAYGTGYPFALFWRQTDAAGRTTAAVSRIDGNVTVCAVKQADLEELWAFLSAAGFDCVLCPEWTAPAGGLLHGCRLARCRPMRLLSLQAPVVCGPVSFCGEPPLPAVYSLLQAAGEPLPCLEAWLPDVSHRVRHGAALVWAAQEDEQWVACAMAVALTRREALLGGVAVLPAQRGRGVGSYLTASLCEALTKQGKTVYLFRQDGMHEPFYQRMGFAPFGPPALMITQEGV